MLELVKMIEKKLANEQKILDRTADEVTYDWDQTQAEVRQKVLHEVFDSACNIIVRSRGYKPGPVV